MIIQKQIEKIDVLVMSNNWIQLKNTINEASINYHSENGTFSFDDSLGNRMLNYSATITINADVFKLTEIGQTINRSDGSVIAYLGSAEKLT